MIVHRAAGLPVEVISMRGCTLLFLGVLAAVSSGCETPDLTLPSEAEMATFFTAAAGAEVSLNGNVVEVRVPQSQRDVRRGGALWAKVGPYIYLFTEDTRSLFQNFTGLAGVRVITYTDGGRAELARALLLRDGLTDILWRRSLNISGRARRDGTIRPSLLEGLVIWGEDHTEFKYDPRYVSRR